MGSEEETPWDCKGFLYLLALLHHSKSRVKSCGVAYLLAKSTTGVKETVRPWGYWVPLALLGGNRPEFLPFGVISYHSVYVTWEQQGEKGGFRIKTKDASIRHMGLYLWTIWVLSGDFYGALVKLLPRAIKYIAGKGQAPTACHNHQPSRSSWVTDISSANRLVNPA